MAYCTECGGEVATGAKFCPECGSAVDGGQDDESAAAESAERPAQSGAPAQPETGIRWKMVATGVAMGLLIAFFATWATLNLGPLSGVAFLLGLVGGGYYVSQKSSVSDGIGSGLYITALLMILTPILFYVPTVLGGADGTAAGAGRLIGSVLGLVIWGFVFLLLAIVTAAVGYFFKRRARA